MSISVLGGIWDFVLGWLNIIPKYMYFLCATVMSVVDALQLVLRKLAGLDVYYVDGVANTGDIALNFIKSIFTDDTRYPALKNVFWSLIIFGVILLVVATIIATIRNEYNPSAKDNKKEPIIGSFVKSLFMFLIVPVSCVFGLFLLDTILVSLDKITAGNYSSQITQIDNVDSKLKSDVDANGLVTYTYYDFFGARTPCSTTTFSGMMFKTAAYSCNRVRLNNKYNGTSFYEGLSNNELSNFGLFTFSTQEQTALVIDECFANCVQLKAETKIELGFMESTVNSAAWALRGGKTIEGFSKFNVGLVFCYYDLWQFNFVVAFAFFFITIKIFGNIIFGLMRRLIEMVALFIISPTFVAIMPLDGGKAFDKWRKNFLSRALSVIACVIGMNVLFLILPYLSEIQLFDPSQLGMQALNLIFSTLFMIVGLNLLETLLQIFSKMIGADDINKSGADTAKNVGEVVAGSAKMTGALAGLTVTPLKIAAKHTVAKPLGAAANAAKAKFYSFKISGKDKEQIEKDAQQAAEKDFIEGGLGNEFEQDINSMIAEDIENAYQKYAKRYPNGKSKEEWQQSSTVAKRLRDNAIAKYTTSKTGKAMNKQDYISSQKANYINRKKSDYSKQKLGEMTQAGTGTRMKGLGNLASNLGYKNLMSFKDLVTDDIKGSVVRSGKGGFATMNMAFKGVSNKQMEEQAAIKKLQKEETARYTAQQKAREKIEKTNKK